MDSSNGLRLNLGCGLYRLPGFVNVDKYGDPDLLHDLETFPWPWEESSVDGIVMHHVLEHLGETTAIYLQIIRELYRICKPGAQIHITVPHPRNDDFLNDPTHVRVITENGMALFSKEKNLEWQRDKRSNSPLGLYLNVDFALLGVTYILAPSWQEKLDNKLCTQEEMYAAIAQYNNVVKETKIVLEVVK